MITPNHSTPPDRDSAAQQNVEKLFLAHSGAIKGFIRALLRDRNLADDVLQDTFLVVCAKREAYTAGTNFVAWACTIARFKVLETLRKNAKAELVLSNEVIEALAADVPQEDRREFTLKHLDDCLKNLPDGSRRMIDLHYFQTRAPDAIASKLSLHIDSVYVALSRARTMLRRCVAGKMAENSGAH